ncbi:hypothetical protein V500_08597 [Pseudogymnoascus sp. VKM F-4518 (FW-2643)]|nr:hypothetical protein V500_08597 [Pseudogymnoascus sp. VKM F-4518 (FW-2643)]
MSAQTPTTKKPTPTTPLSTLTKSKPALQTDYTARARIAKDRLKAHRAAATQALEKRAYLSRIWKEALTQKVGNSESDASDPYEAKREREKMEGGRGGWRRRGGRGGLRR